MRRLQHILVAECAIHFWLKVLLVFQMLRCVDYMALQDAVSAHPVISNVEINGSRLSDDGVIYGDSGRWIV